MQKKHSSQNIRVSVTLMLTICCYMFKRNRMFMVYMVWTWYKSDVYAEQQATKNTFLSF